MKTYIAFLRGINVGGNTRLPMEDLRNICKRIELNDVRTYIQSGNVLFKSDLPEEALVKSLEQALYLKVEKNIPVIIRAAEALAEVLSNNPFPNAKPDQVGVMFFMENLPKDLLKDVTHIGDEEIVVAKREIYIHYPSGMGRSKLKLPLMQLGTVRNINTITKLVEMI